MALARTCIPAAKMESDCYDWYQRSESKKEWSRDHKAKGIFFGDSITHFWSKEDNNKGYGEDSWEEFFAGKDVLNMGYGFDRIQNILWHLEAGEVDGQEPGVIVVNIGTNNYSHTLHYPGDTAEETAEGILFLTEKLQEKFPSSHIVLMGIFPRWDRMEKIRMTNRILAEKIPLFPYAEMVDIFNDFLDENGNFDTQYFQKDRCHLCRKGYVVWYNAIRHILEKYL